MSMSAPMEPNIPSSEDGGGIPAADAGNGAPPPAEGFGLGGEEPDAPEQTDEDSPTTGSPDGTVFRTPDPTSVGPEATGNPVDPAVSTTSPDPGQTGRDQR